MTYNTSKPTEYMSDRPGFLSLKNRVHVQPGLPPDRPAVPKSPILIVIFSSPFSYFSSVVMYSMFSGFKSLWHLSDTSSCWRPWRSCLQISIDCVRVNFFWVDLVVFFSFEMFPSHSSNTKTSYFFTSVGQMFEFKKLASSELSSRWNCCLKSELMSDK